MRWSMISKAGHTISQPRVFAHLAFVLLLALILLQSGQLAQPSGYLLGRVLLENGEVAEGAEVFFKVQKAFGASCYSRECDSFQKAVFRRRVALSRDGLFEIHLPARFMNPPDGGIAYVYTVVVRTPWGQFRPFYAFEIGPDKHIVNEFLLKPPFLDTLPGGEDESTSVY
jgi:hypothetical protein